MERVLVLGVRMDREGSGVRAGGVGVTGREICVPTQLAREGDPWAPSMDSGSAAAATGGREKARGWGEGGWDAGET